MSQSQFADPQSAVFTKRCKGKVSLFSWAVSWFRAKPHVADWSW